MKILCYIKTIQIREFLFKEGIYMKWKKIIFLGDLKATSGRFKSVVDFGLSQLQATAIKPKVKPWVDTFTTISHDITEVSLRKNIYLNY